MREATNKLIDLAENGVLDWKTIARKCLHYMSECLHYMSEDDVADMASCNDWIEDEDEEDDEDGD